ncbi:MAG: DUF5662 family protein [Longicatena sp.]
MKRFWGHLKTITKHKLKVTRLCFRCGLYKQGFLHDLSKYSWIEFWSGVKYYQGNRSPIDREKEVNGYSLGWLHHKGRNKHHWEYWLDNAYHGVKPVEMPINYVIEMFCDRIAASQIYQKENYTDASAYLYLMNGYPHVIMHEKTLALISDLLCRVKDHGLDETIVYIKNNLR